MRIDPQGEIIPRDRELRRVEQLAETRLLAGELVCSGRGERVLPEYGARGEK